MASNQIILTAEGIAKSYQENNQASIIILKNFSMTVTAGELVAITGASGSGKSTLLHILAGLDQPDNGSVTLKQQRLDQLSEPQQCQLRNQYLGFIYQFHYLLPEFTALENVAMPLWLSKNCSHKSALQQASELLNKIGLARQARQKPAELSGGERQRVAIARALVSKPSCLLADEPTGNLDQHNAQQIFQLIKQLCTDTQCAAVIVTHDSKLAQQCDRVVCLD